MRGASVRPVLAIALCAVTTIAMGAGTAAASSGTTRVSLAGSGSAQTGDFTPSGVGGVTRDEFPAGDNDTGPDPYNGTISLSTGAGGGPSVSNGKRTKSNPTFKLRL